MWSWELKPFLNRLSDWSNVSSIRVCSRASTISSQIFNAEVSSVIPMDLQQYLVCFFYVQLGEFPFLNRILLFPRVLVLYLFSSFNQPEVVHRIISRFSLSSCFLVLFHGYLVFYQVCCWSIAVLGSTFTMFYYFFPFCWLNLLPIFIIFNTPTLREYSFLSPFRTLLCCFSTMESVFSCCLSYLHRMLLWPIHGSFLNSFHKTLEAFQINFELKTPCI